MLWAHWGNVIVWNLLFVVVIVSRWCLVVVCQVISQRHYESTVRYNHLTVSVRNISLSCSTVSAWRTTIPVFLLPPLPFSVVAICITNEKVEVENVGSVKKKTGEFSQTAQIAVARTSSNNNNSQLSVNQMENRAKLWLHRGRRLNNYNR